MKPRCAGLVAALALTACAPAPDAANPALWRIDGPAGEHGWLFGTIHALPRPAAWRTARIDRALADADRLVVEVARLNDDGATARAFADLARPIAAMPLAARVTPGLRAALARLLARGGKHDSDFATTPSWAAALLLAQIADAGSDTGNGIDRALLAAEQIAPHARPVGELEGARAQLAIFAALAEPEQRALLDAVIADADHAQADGATLAAAWRRGDVATIAHDTTSGMLADPGLHEALYAARNRAWATAIAGELAAGEHPFVAVGAAHLAGDAGLPALLEAKGYTITRIE